MTLIIASSWLLGLRFRLQGLLFCPEFWRLGAGV